MEKAVVVRVGELFLVQDRNGATANLSLAQFLRILEKGGVLLEGGETLFLDEANEGLQASLFDPPEWMQTC